MVLDLMKIAADAGIAYWAGVSGYCVGEAITEVVRKGTKSLHYWIEETLGERESELSEELKQQEQEIKDLAALIEDENEEADS